VSQTQVEVFAALLAAAVAVVGWPVTYLYAKRKDDQTRRTEAKLKHLERQIDELYGPLEALIQQVFAVWRVREGLLSPDSHLTADQKEAARTLIWQDFFFPIHQQIQTLLRTKLHLVEGKVPSSFEAYRQHAVQEAAQHSLWDKLQIDTTGTAERKEWPDQFPIDVFRTLRRLREHYDLVLQHLDRDEGVFAASQSRGQPPRNTETFPAEAAS